MLLTCFNRPLAEHLAATIGRTRRVTVKTFHGLAEAMGQAAGSSVLQPAHDAPYFDTLPDVLDRAIRVLPEDRYDAIVVDEGQDIDSVWWLPLLDLLRDREHGIVYVFGDANQDLYHAREPAEMGVVMPEAPPTYYLTEDRRCTKTIHEFASRYAVTDALPGRRARPGRTVARWRSSAMPMATPMPAGSSSPRRCAASWTLAAWPPQMSWY